MGRAALFALMSGVAHAAVIALVVAVPAGRDLPGGAGGSGAEGVPGPVAIDVVLGPAMRAPLHAEPVSSDAPPADAMERHAAAEARSPAPSPPAASPSAIAAPAQPPMARPVESVREAARAVAVADMAELPVTEARHALAARATAPVVMASLVVEEPQRTERLHRQAMQTARLMPPPSPKVPPKTQAETNPPARQDPVPTARDTEAAPEMASEAASEAGGKGRQGNTQPAGTGARAGPGASAGEAGARGEDLHAAYARALRNAIERQRPPTAGARGTVVVRFTLTPSGALHALEIARSSGRPQLDSATRRAVEGAAPFARPPAEVAAQGLSFTIAFQYR